MSNKKTLKEVFEFFPDAQWITEDDDGNVGIWNRKPEITVTWFSDEDFNDTIIDLNHIKIDWQHRKTWRERCVSRAEVLGD